MPCSCEFCALAPTGMSTPRDCAVTVFREMHAGPLGSQTPARTVDTIERVIAAERERAERAEASCAAMRAAAERVAQHPPWKLSSLGDSHCCWCSVCFNGDKEPSTAEHESNCPIGVFRSLLTTDTGRAVLDELEAGHKLIELMCIPGCSHDGRCGDRGGEYRAAKAAYDRTASARRPR